MSTEVIQINWDREELAHLDDEERQQFLSHSSAIQLRVQNTLLGAWELGEELWALRRMMKYAGEFYSYCEEAFGIGERHARRFMALQQKVGRSDIMSGIQISQTALMVLVTGTEEQLQEGLEKAKAGRVSVDEAKEITSPEPDEQSSDIMSETESTAPGTSDVREVQDAPGGHEAPPSTPDWSDSFEPSELGQPTVIDTTATRVIEQSDVIEAYEAARNKAVEWSETEAGRGCDIAAVKRFTTNIIGKVKGHASPSSHKSWAESVYQAYPKRAGKRAAIREIIAAFKRHPDRDPSWFLEAVREFASSPKAKTRFIPDPERFFKNERYDDDRATWAGTDVGGDDPTFGGAVYDG